MVDLGWDLDKANVMVTQDGVRYDLTRTSPKLMGRLAGDAARISRDRGELRQRRQGAAPWLENEGPGCPGIFWQNLRPGEGKLGKGLTQREVGALGSVQSLCHWPHQRLFDRQKAEEATRKLCGSEPGTLFHRRFRCCATQAHRDKEMPATFRGWLTPWSMAMKG